MTPRKFDRYMVSVGAGTHPKFARLTDPERCAHFLGVLAIAAMAPLRGRLLVGNLPAEAVDVARAAGVNEKVAESAMRKLMAVGILLPDEEHDCLRVHDWDDINPSPGAERTRQWRDKKTSQERHATVTGNGDTRHADVTESSPEVKKLEVGKTATQSNTNVELRSTVAECFGYWQERCGHETAKLSPDRRRKMEARLREGYTVHDIRRGIDGAARAAFVNDAGKRFDDIELICRSGSKLEDFMARASADANVFPLSPTERVVAGRNRFIDH